MQPGKCDCPCVTSLLDLQVKHSSLSLHSSGLSACTGLQDLTLCGCHIVAEQPDDEVDLYYRDHDGYNAPSSITALAQLTHLSVQLDCVDSDLPYDMSWMSLLPSDTR